MLVFLKWTVSDGGDEYFLSVDDLENNTDYVNYLKDDQVIKWFWEVLKEASESEKADFLMFATGTLL